MLDIDEVTVGVASDGAQAAPPAEAAALGAELAGAPVAVVPPPPQAATRARAPIDKRVTIRRDMAVSRLGGGRAPGSVFPYADGGFAVS
jgi:hypothetical protein